MANNGRVLLAATVTDVGIGPFVYPACERCYRKLTVSQEHGCQVHRCQDCRQVYNSGETNYRYRLCLTVTDSTTLASVTGFGGMLNSFFGVTATDFQNKYVSTLRDKFGTSSHNLIQIAIEQALIGQRLLFGLKLATSYGNLPHTKDRGTVLKDICQNWDIWSEKSSTIRHLSEFIAVQIVRQSDIESATTVVGCLHHLMTALEDNYLTPADCADKAALLQLLSLCSSRWDIQDSLVPDITITNRVATDPANSSWDVSLDSADEQSSLEFSCDLSQEAANVLDNPAPPMYDHQCQTVAHPCQNDVMSPLLCQNYEGCQSSSVTKSLHSTDATGSLVQSNLQNSPYKVTIIAPGLPGILSPAKFKNKENGVVKERVGNLNRDQVSESDERGPESSGDLMEDFPDSEGLDLFLTQFSSDCVKDCAESPVQTPTLKNLEQDTSRQTDSLDFCSLYKEWQKKSLSSKGKLLKLDDGSCDKMTHVDTADRAASLLTSSLRCSIHHQKKQMTSQRLGNSQKPNLSQNFYKRAKQRLSLKQEHLTEQALPEKLKIFQKQTSQNGKFYTYQNLSQGVNDSRNYSSVLGNKTEGKITFSHNVNISSSQTFPQIVNISSNQTFPQIVNISSNETFPQIVNISSNQTFPQIVNISKKHNNNLLNCAKVKNKQTLLNIFRNTKKQMLYHKMKNVKNVLSHQVQCAVKNIFQHNVKNSKKESLLHRVNNKEKQTLPQNVSNSKKRTSTLNVTNLKNNTSPDTANKPKNKSLLKKFKCQKKRNLLKNVSSTVKQTLSQNFNCSNGQTIIPNFNSKETISPKSVKNPSRQTWSMTSSTPIMVSDVATNSVDQESLIPCNVTFRHSKRRHGEETFHTHQDGSGREKLLCKGNIEETETTNTDKCSNDTFLTGTCNVKVASNFKRGLCVEDETFGSSVVYAKVDEVSFGSSVATEKVDEVSFGSSVATEKVDEVSFGSSVATAKVDELSFGSSVATAKVDEVSFGSSVATEKVDELSFGSSVATAKVDELSFGSSVATAKVDEVSFGSSVGCANSFKAESSSSYHLQAQPETFNRRSVFYGNRLCIKSTTGPKLFQRGKQKEETVMGCEELSDFDLEDMNKSGNYLKSNLPFGLHSKMFGECIVAWDRVARHIDHLSCGINVTSPDVEISEQNELGVAEISNQNELISDISKQNQLVVKSSNKNELSAEFSKQIELVVNSSNQNEILMENFKQNKCLMENINQNEILTENSKQNGLLHEISKPYDLISKLSKQNQLMPETFKQNELVSEVCIKNGQAPEICDQTEDTTKVCEWDDGSNTETSEQQRVKNTGFREELNQPQSSNDMPCHYETHTTFTDVLISGCQDLDTINKPGTLMTKSELEDDEHEIWCHPPTPQNPYARFKISKPLGIGWRPRKIANDSNNKLGNIVQHTGEELNAGAVQSCGGGEELNAGAVRGCGGGEELNAGAVRGCGVGEVLNAGAVRSCGGGEELNAGAVRGCGGGEELNAGAVRSCGGGEAGCEFSSGAVTHLLSGGSCNEVFEPLLSDKSHINEVSEHLLLDKSHINEVSEHLLLDNSHINEVSEHLLLDNSHINEVSEHLLLDKSHINEVSEHLLLDNSHINEVSEYLLPDNSQDLFSSDDENLVSTMDNASVHTQSQKNKCETLVPALNGLQYSLANSSDSLQDDSRCSLASFRRRKMGKRVRFSKRKLEHCFFGFEIISHMPVVSRVNRNLKPSLKRCGPDSEPSGSQDLFSESSDDNIGLKVFSETKLDMQPLDKWDSSSELFSQSPEQSGVINATSTPVVKNHLTVCVDRCGHGQYPHNGQTLTSVEAKHNFVCTEEFTNDCSFDLFMPNSPSETDKRNRNPASTRETDRLTHISSRTSHTPVSSWTIDPCPTGYWMDNLTTDRPVSTREINRTSHIPVSAREINRTSETPVSARKNNRISHLAMLSTGNCTFTDCVSPDLFS